MAKLLVCDDESGLRAVINRYAKFEGHETIECSNGKEAVELCKTTDFDLIIMDIMMPILDGYSAVKEIRQSSNVPVIMLSAKGEEYDKILGFEMGIDDYVVKPFSSKELMHRVNAILRRSQKNSPPISKEKSHLIFKNNGLYVDMTAYKVSIDGIPIDMTPKGYELLFFLIKNKNRAITREKILQEVWGYNYYGDDRTLDTHMKLLRKALGKYSKSIVTIRGLGYRFEG